MDRQVRRRGLLLAGTAFACGLHGAAALAQPGYPNRPLRLVVGAAPGGNVDLTARIVARRLGELLGQPVVVENRVGAGGAIAFNAVRQSAPDGYTLLLAPTGFTTAVALNPNAGYDPVRDFTAIGGVSQFAYAIAVAAGAPWATLPELLAAARTKPGAIGYGTGGIGSGQHLVAELLAAAAGVQWLHVPYKGGAAPVTDLVGGQIPMVVEIESVLAPHVRAGRVRVLATTGAARSPLLPEVPTVAEAGVRDFAVQGWLGVLGPRGLAPEPVARLAAALRQTLADAEVIAAIEKGGAVARSSTPEAFAALVESDTRRWARVVREANIPVQ
jgi:tripartite-type tricarboxylate transporter receptor subunit TctC